MLRPKTFGVLSYLVQHPDRLVSKEELLAAVWPNLVVTDDTLVQSIGELRRALGETGARLIVTVPRRGYRFEAAEAPPDRRKARSWHPLRFRWKYGILAPLAVAASRCWCCGSFQISERCRRDSGVAQAKALHRRAAVPAPG